MGFGNIIAIYHIGLVLDVQHNEFIHVYIEKFQYIQYGNKSSYHPSPHIVRKFFFL